MGLHLEVRHFFLGAGARGLTGVCDLYHGAEELALAIGVDRDQRLVADLHVDDVVFIHVDTGFHVGQIGDAHHFRARKLVRRHHALTLFAVENCDRAVDRRIDCRFGKLIARLARSGFRALDFVLRAVVRRSRDIARGLGGVVFRFGNHFLGKEILRPFQVLLCFGQGRLRLKIHRLRGADRGLLLLDQSLIGVRFDLEQ